jgi:NAD(P)-dependent dehydrogenase (short-subunit alcohol dehydrogenase family)
MPAALITGGTSGIGLVIARALMEDGYHVTISSRRQEKVQAASDELGVYAVVADISKEEDCARLVAEHRARFGRIDVLVNSAGIGIGGRYEDLSVKHFDLQYAVNMRGLFIVTKLCLPLLKESRGWIVNLASIAGMMPTPGLGAYGDTKAAVIHFTQSAEPRARRRRRARGCALPRTCRHADGRVVGHPRRRNDPARGLCRDRANAAPLKPARPRPADRDRTRRRQRGCANPKGATFIDRHAIILR